MILICLFGALELKQPLCLSSSSFKAKYFSLVAPHDPLGHIPLAEIIQAKVETTV